jgi:DNA-binding transcriptional MerR regulator
MDRFSNADISRITGLSARQIIYLSERGVIDSDIEKAAGRGTTRWYSKANVFEFLVAKTLRNAMLEWPAIKAIVTVVSTIYTELFSMVPNIDPDDTPTVLHIAERKYFYLTTHDGRIGKKVLEVTPEGCVTESDLTIAEVRQRTDYEIIIYLEKRLALLKGI